MMTRQACRKSSTPKVESLPYEGLTCDKALKKHALVMRERKTDADKGKQEKKKDVVQEEKKRKPEAEEQTRKQEAKEQERNHEALAEKKKDVVEKRKEEKKKGIPEAKDKKQQAVPEYKPNFIIRQLLRVSDMPIKVPRDSVYRQIAALKTPNDVKMWQKKNPVPYFALSRPKTAVGVVSVLGVGSGGVLGFFSLNQIKQLLEKDDEPNVQTHLNQSGGGYNDSTLNRKLINLVNLAKIHKWFQTPLRWVGLELLMRPDFAWVFAEKAFAIGALTGVTGAAVKLFLAHMDPHMRKFWNNQNNKQRDNNPPPNLIVDDNYDPPSNLMVNDNYDPPSNLMVNDPYNYDPPSNLMGNYHNFMMEDL